jgi:hypothetical protein
MSMALDGIRAEIRAGERWLAALHECDRILTAAIAVVGVGESTSNAPDGDPSLPPPGVADTADRPSPSTGGPAGALPPADKPAARKRTTTTLNDLARRLNITADQAETALCEMRDEDEVKRGIGHVWKVTPS